MATDTSRCICSGMGLSMATDASGCPVPAWTHPQVTVPLTRVHTGVPACPVQQHRNSSDALAICQPRRITIAVIKLFPGTAQEDDQQYSEQRKQKAATNEHWTLQIFLSFKSMGPDGIHPRVLKELADVMAGPLSIIYQRSWESGEVPADWKLANVIPIYKKGVREDPGNYRPVSLISVPGKIMEKIILGATERHLKNNAIIRHSQHGFTKGKPCLTNLVSFYDKVTQQMDEGKAVDVVFLDFDTALHSILLDKLSSCGMSRFTVRWVKNWLKDRTQRVVVNGATSGW
ncbi:mitochondrial enolase superfamily member 1 [Grus japonensis]|uniref:Mitochondrial enolase superfamily member 1 n=1 Tax=Grus japonensis TaxID=30415 RepID=A0ABC9WAG8_GRUJA